MNQDNLNRLLQMLEGTSVREIEYSDGDSRIRLVRGPRTRDAASASEAPERTVAPGEAIATPSQAPVQPNHVVTAGLVGTFYRSASPEQAPFVSVGDTVQEGQTLAIVEAMKLLNSIEADRAGRIIEVCADDGASVSPDSILFALQPLEESHV